MEQSTPREPRDVHAAAPASRRHRGAEFALALFLLVPVGTLIHELGHCAVALGIGQRITAIGLAGGLVIYPKLEWRWSGKYLGWMTAAGGDPSLREQGAIKLGGSGIDWGIAILASTLLLLVRKPGRARWLLRVFSLFHIDGLAYTFLPQLGLRHGILFGGPTAEPLEGAIALGISSLWFQVAVVATSVFCTAALLLHLHSCRANLR